MNEDDLKKLDTIPTSNKPWYLRTPFFGIFAFILSLLLKAVLNWLK